MSNVLRRKSNKVRKRRRGKECNSWAYVVFASIVDCIFSYSWHESQTPEPIFGLSDCLGELGRQRQEKLSLVFISFLFLVGIAVTIYMRVVYQETQRWIGCSILTAIIGVFLFITFLIKIQKRKRQND
ncbi:hypothetical protein [Pseudobutyrivibrio xylanivorans]|uniref:Transmembrane protein n=1 Tax=Pseudobutyrivibrio xylanivorans TaxID=185007 RepID=A0A5P6VNH0_PSEXY|nr:hypothetical protein [Pseudobutyrivibrio xylanivorans]QFJ54226.1 hypothetical protein FXF36_04755 [Pseudobutyrivibrio xylanivorans]